MFHFKRQINLFTFFVVFLNFFPCYLFFKFNRVIVTQYKKKRIKQGFVFLSFYSQLNQKSRNRQTGRLNKRNKYTDNERKTDRRTHSLTDIQLDT